ncbi:MAG: hypothetical protein MZV64_28015 [Ignavibacteriales bacterium]|nr:hypothetical protein [Ignavibacteriales bacterium]
MVIYGALTRRDTAGPRRGDGPHPARRASPGRADADGRRGAGLLQVRATRRLRPEARPTTAWWRLALKNLEPAAGTRGACRGGVLPSGNRRRWRAQAAMTIAPTPRAWCRAATQELRGRHDDVAAAAPVYDAGRPRCCGVLDGGVLLNRNYEIVDKIRRTVFKRGGA